MRCRSALLLLVLLGSLALESRADERAPAANTLRIVNPTGTPKYLDWMLGPSSGAITAEQRVGNSFRRVGWSEPDCMSACRQPPQATPCPECEKPMPRVMVVPAKGEARVTWDGHLYEVKAAAACSCFMRRVAPVGRYRFQVCAARKLKCEPKCGKPDAEGMVHEARTVGPLECVSAEIAIPSAQRAVTLTLGK